MDTAPSCDTSCYTVRPATWANVYSTRDDVPTHARERSRVALNPAQRVNGFDSLPNGPQPDERNLCVSQDGVALQTTSKPSWLQHTTIMRILIVGGFLLIATLVFVVVDGGTNFVDQRIYHGAINWWLTGHNLYEYLHPPELRWGFTYPPTGALLMAPMELVTVEQAIVISSVAIVVTTATTAVWLAIPIADRHGLPRWFLVGAALPVTAMLGPIRENFEFGQVSLFLAVLVLVDLIALRRGKKWAGLGIGLATAVKLTPGFFILYLLVTRQWRAALTASGVAGAATLFGLVAGPGMWWDFWTSVLWNTNRVGSMGSSRNQSLAGLLTRLQNTDFEASQSRPHLLLWAVAGVLVLFAALRRAYMAHRAGNELAAFTIAGLAAALLSPISWVHHLFWVLPAIALVVDAGLGRRELGRLYYFGIAVVATAIFSSGAVHIFWHPGGHHYDDGILGVLAGSSYTAGCILLLFMTPWHTTSTSAQERTEALQPDMTGRIC